MPQIIFLSIIATTMISTVLTMWDEISKCQEIKITVLFWSPFLVIGIVSYIIYSIKEWRRQRKDTAYRKAVYKRIYGNS